MLSHSFDGELQILKVGDITGFGYFSKKGGYKTADCRNTTFCEIDAECISPVVNGQVNWGMGIALGIGNMLGAWLGTHVAIKKGHDFIKQVVTVAVIGFAIKLLLDN